MNSILAIFNSSIGKKILMSLTGLFLVVFLIIHLTGNLQLLKSDEGLSFNSYAAFMTSNPLIKVVSWGTYIIILLHAFKGLALAVANKNSRNNKYVRNGSSKNSHWTSRNMGILGTIILAFVIVHMSDFWWQYKFGETPWTEYTVELKTGETISTQDVTGEGYKQSVSIVNAEKGTETLVTKDLYKKVQATFANPIFVMFYVLSMLAIAFHLWHGFASAFQTLGANHPKYNSLIRGLGKVFSVLVPLGFALIPVLMYLSHCSTH